MTEQERQEAAAYEQEFRAEVNARLTRLEEKLDRFVWKSASIFGAGAVLVIVIMDKLNS